jgi:hypothetical protein
MTKEYRVTLTAEERRALREILNRGKRSVQKRKRAQGLLLCDGQFTDAEVAERAGMHRQGVEGIRQRFVEKGFEVTLRRYSQGTSGASDTRGRRGTADSDGLQPETGRI